MPCSEYNKLKNEVDLARDNISYWSREGNNFFSKSGKTKAIKKEHERYSDLSVKLGQHTLFCASCKLDEQSA